jgi:peptidyl-prolyl cis-trans isomerase A (cyclophilin A)
MQRPLSALFVVLSFLFVLSAAPAGARADNVVVRFTTVLGTFDVELCSEVSAACPGVAPNTVTNFLRYVDENVYPDTMFIHRRGTGPPSGSPLVIQGGGYWIDNDPPPPSTEPVPSLGNIPLELGAGLSNVQGTIAMARGQQAATANSQWFINLVDNVNLDTAGGGYAVFGKVVQGFDVVDAIGDLTIYSAGGAFTELPLLDTYPGGGADALPYLVYVPDISRVPEAGAFASAAAAALSLTALAKRRRG